MAPAVCAVVAVAAYDSAYDQYRILRRGRRAYRLLEGRMHGMWLRLVARRGAGNGIASYGAGVQVLNIIQNILDFFKTLLQWWFIVEPWEQAVRVRFGKNVHLFNGGTHFRVPFFDSVYTQNVRRRMTSIGSQTVTTRDRKLVTIHSTLGFTIVDVLLLQ